MDPRNPDFDADVRAAFAQQGLMQSFDAQLTAISAGHVEITAPITDDVSQHHGYAHAGLTFALGDSAAGFAAQTLLAKGQSVVTIEMKINLLAPARGSQLIARGEVLRAGRRISSAEADVIDDQGKLIAKLLGSMAIVDT